MGASDDLLLGRLIVKLGFAAPEQIEEAVRIQASTREPIGQILLSKGYLSEEDLRRAIEVQNQHLYEVDTRVKKRRIAHLFGKLAVREGYVTSAQLNECLAQQGDRVERRTLGEIMLEKGYLTRDQVRDLLQKQKKRLMGCPTCGLQFTVHSLSEHKAVPCPRCKGPLVETGPSAPAHADAELSALFSTSVILPAPSPEVPVRRVTCLVCDHLFDGALDPTGRVQCPRCGSNFTPR